MLYYVNGCRKRKEEFDKELKNAVSTFVFGDEEHTKEEIKKFNSLLNQCWETLKKGDTIQVNWQKFEIKNTNKTLNCYINNKEVSEKEFYTLLKELLMELTKFALEIYTHLDFKTSFNNVYKTYKGKLFKDGKLDCLGYKFKITKEEK